MRSMTGEPEGAPVPALRLRACDGAAPSAAGCPLTTEVSAKARVAAATMALRSCEHFG